MARKKLLLISDDLRAPSGVGTQGHWLVKGLIEKYEWDVVQIGGAIHPQSTQMVQYGPHVQIYPVHGYGDLHMIRSLLAREKPDAMMIFTDPRFFYWLWDMENEIRTVCPLTYWHVWDNDPYPDYNGKFYRSTDFIAGLSYKTFSLLRDGGKFVIPDHVDYIPHGLPLDIYKEIPAEHKWKFRKEVCGKHADSFKVFWNNRNARRKMTGDVMESFKVFLNMLPEEERKKCVLIMHTDPNDQEGTDMNAVSGLLDLHENIIVSSQKVPFENMIMAYNIMDVTLNIANNEGFGLATLESLACSVPIIVLKTGGLQYQVTNEWLPEDVKKHGLQEYGIGIEPAVRNLCGSQLTPYIYDDRVDNQTVADAIMKMYKMDPKERKEKGVLGRKYVERHFDIEDVTKQWDTALRRTVDLHKKNYKSWKLVEA